MENPFNTEENNNQTKRSALLTVLLVLTFIGSGFNFISNAYLSLNLQSVLEAITELGDDEDMSSTFGSLFEQSLAIMESAGALYYGIVALLGACSVAGAVLMFRMNKLGFHFYAAAQIVWLLIPTLFGVEKFPGILSIILTALFIWLYARELNMFEKQHTSSQQE
ncbi:MAG: hypothetical protein LBU91_08890 [Bacteroidales bacterium]|jgi:hypothetical protein|nr:hypothetical protein [Bacteroidales bacterium]